MCLHETTYGINKRFSFLTEVIGEVRPASVLDVGCGTGVNLTYPLAKHFPDVRFLGIYSDTVSIEFARNHDTLSNLSFLEPSELVDGLKFDLIVCSEVIEHVEDPAAFLASLVDRLSERGKIVVTVPNGYGPFEIASWAESLLYLSGIYQLLRRCKRFIRGRSLPALQTDRDTLAVCPHINFFSCGDLRRLFASTGLTELKYRARTFLCGFGFDQAIRSEASLTWNARVADRLPRWTNSAWMFLLEPTGRRQGRQYKRGLYARIRRYLNERRLALEDTSNGRGE